MNGDDSDIYVYSEEENNKVTFKTLTEQIEVY